MNNHPATAQETAAEYLNAGLWQDGADVLLQAAGAAPDQAKIRPMLYYYLGYFAEKLGQPEKAAGYYKLAMALPPDYVFPFQNEAIIVLRAAIAANPADPRAPYYLGNLLYDWQPEEAVKLWQASAAIDPSFAIVHRNLATAYMHRKSGSDLDKAVAELEKAVACPRQYPIHFTELDELYEQAGAPLAKRDAVFAKNAATVTQRDDAQNRAIGVKVALGQYDEAIQMMSERRFAIAEGANLNAAEYWTRAHILRGRQRIEARQFDQALADFQSALHVPENLPLEFGNVTNAEANYWTAVAFQGLGDRQKATESWKQAASPVKSNDLARQVNLYYQALALQKLGKAADARLIFQDLVSAGQKALALQPARSRRALAHYVTGLGYLGLGDQAAAKTELNLAVQADPGLAEARVALSKRS